MNEPIGKYRTLVASNHEELDALVNEAIDDDWQPFGGAYIGIHPQNTLFYQPVVKPHPMPTLPPLE